MSPCQRVLAAVGSSEHGTRLIGAAACCLQSSHKLQVVVVCEEALPRTMYSARTNEVGPLAESLATEMVMEAQPGMSEVRRPCGYPQKCTAPERYLHLLWH